MCYVYKDQLKYLNVTNEIRNLDFTGDYACAHTFICY